MFRGYKYRIYPTKEQEVLLNKHFGACRFIYNLALETKQMAYMGAKANLSAFELMGQLTSLKEDLPWLKEVNSQSLQASIVDMDSAYTNFFRRQAKYPNFKNKHSKQSFRCPQKVSIDNEVIYLPKFKQGIKIVLSRPFEGKIKTVTVSKTPTGKYFASVLVDNDKSLPKKKPIRSATTIGLDMGLIDFVTTSTGEKYSNPKHLKQSIDRLSILQRRLSKKKKGSVKRKKARHKVALLHEKISNQRNDFLHKLSSKLISENQTVCIEDLNISGMMKNKSLSRSIGDAGWYGFTQMLKYKAEWQGKNLLQIGRFDASTKICSCCGATKHGLTLSDRRWDCDNCGTTQDRDINAAINIKSIALRKTPRGTRKEPVEMSALVGSMKQEVSI